MPLPNVLVVAALLTQTLFAQMSGNYTIDPNGRGTRNFTSLNAASFQLAIVGVNGPVKLTIANGSYFESWHLAPIPGASSKNLVVFKSATPLGAKMLEPKKKTTSPYTALMIQDYGSSTPVRWIVLDGIEFSTALTTGSASHYALYAGGNCSDFEIKNCKFDSVRVGARGAGKNIKRWHIHHNSFACRLYTFRIMFFEFVDAFDIHHNDIQLYGQDGLWISTASGAAQTRIWNNLIYGSSSGRATAMLMLELAHNTVVEHNTFVITSTPTTFSGVCLRAGGLFARPVFVRNNIFSSGAKLAPVEYLSTDSRITSADGNIYWAPNARNLVSRITSSSGSQSGWTTLASWQVASGMDSNSLNVDPKLKSVTKNPPDFDVQIGSPAVGKAVKSSAFIKDDFVGNTRFPKATIGAYEGFLPIAFTAFGAGCAGSGAKVPRIGSSGEHRLGSKNFRVTLSNARGGFGVTAFLVIGGSTKTWGTIPLPHDFGGGCKLFVSMDVLLALPMSGASGAGNGTSGFNLTIPNDPKLRGAKAHFQWGVADSSAKGIGIAFSDGGTLTL